MIFAKSGDENTAETAALAMARAKELGITHLVVASNTGETIRHFLGHGFSLVCVTHHIGFRSPGAGEMDSAVREELTRQGVKILTTTHLFAGLDRAVRNKFGGVYPSEIMAQTLRMLGQGVKVAVEVAGMALDAGLIPYGEDVVAVGGTNRGADAAIVIRPAHSNQFFDTMVKEIICKPFNP